MVFNGQSAARLRNVSESHKGKTFSKSSGLVLRNVNISDLKKQIKTYKTGKPQSVFFYFFSHLPELGKVEPKIGPAGSLWDIFHKNTVSVHRVVRPRIGTSSLKKIKKSKGNIKIKRLNPKN
jgi:hypothetical protein